VSAQINEAHTSHRPMQRKAIFLGFDCPVRGRRV